jgi:YaiO family outer membrane protein
MRVMARALLPAAWGEGARRADEGRRLTRVFILILLIAATAAAQDDPIARARELRVLEVQLLQNPMDEDARTRYGTVLSWQRRFDEARQELRIVLSRNPRNLDARLALIRVELWSGHPREADRLAAESLALFPGNAELQMLRNQARGPQAQSLLSIGATYDSYEDRDDWQESFIEFKQPVRIGALVGRAAHARRFGLDDDQFEIQFYPRIGRRGWASLSAAYAPDAVLYPETRLNAELYHALGRGFEASAGVSRLDFSDGGATNVYTGSLGKYIGNWLIGARLYTAEGDTALHAAMRRFFGDNGQYFELRFGEGTSRDAIRSATDIEALDVREIAAEALFAPGRHWTFRLRGGIGRTSDREDRFSVSAALGWRF